MLSSWSSYVSQCKSRLSAIARCCYLGREFWRKKFQETRQLLEQSEQKVGELEVLLGQLERQNSRLEECVSDLEEKLAEPPPAELPLGEAPRGQQYGAGMMALSVNLARKIGLRRAESAMHVFFDWLQVDKPQIPTHGSIRIWKQRIGLDRIQHAAKVTGGTWLVDHTNQIGKEKVLTVLRVRPSRLPRRGVPLRHRDVEVLAVLPGEQWKREDVKKAYDKLAGRYGTPRAIVTDGAVELHEPAETLGKKGKKPMVIRDPKHFLANSLEALLKQDPQWAAFALRLGGTRSALQQTELAHFIPPAFKSKARFMNLAPTLEWAATVLWHLEHPESRSRKGISEDRMIEKLGWIRDFAPSIRQWEGCQQVISTALTFVNKQGIYRGAARRFKKLVMEHEHNPMSLQLANTMVEFLRKHQRRLRPNERLPMSTEILESSFSIYKRLEAQHSKSGFTSLLLTFPVLLRETTPEEVNESLQRVKVADVKQWAKEHLPSTLASKRQLIFREARGKPKKETRNGATPVRVAA